MMTDSGFVQRWTRRSAGIAILSASILGTGIFAAMGQVTSAPGTAKKRPKFNPPDYGSPKIRVTAATRGPGRDRVQYLGVLAPEQVGHTMTASPTLYWYLSQPFAGSVKVVLADDAQVEPVLELQLERGAPAGVHEVPLGEHRVVLKPGTEYQWSVTLVDDPDQPSGNPFASGAIRRVAPVALPKGADDADRLVALAGQGLWYDAIELASRRIAARPKDAAWRELRADLLEQQGLTVPAVHDRELAGTQ
jgi:hypothetical protein